MRARDRLYPYSVVCCVVWLWSSTLSSLAFSGFISKDYKDILALLWWLRRNHVAMFKNVGTQ